MILPDATAILPALQCPLLPQVACPHSFPPSFSYYLLIQGDSGITDRGRTDTEYDSYSKSSLMGDNSDFTLHS